MRTIDQHFMTPPGGPLFHYTGFESLVGIQRSNAVWAGSIHYMNDAMEVLSACDAVDELLAPLIAFGEDSDLKRGFARAMVQWIGELRGDTTRSVFVFSLSESESLLSQWRSYTPHGKGVSIGFQPELLNSMCRSSGFRLAKCVYDIGGKLELLKDLFEKLWATATQQPFNGQPYAPLPPHTNIFNVYASDIYQVLALIKDNAFREEQEWRLISPLHDDLANCEVRVGKSMLVPYLSIGLGDQKPTFSRVILGPTPHKELSMASLWAYLSKKQVSSSVEHCNIPYREW
jgi:hypothetical protein